MSAELNQKFIDDPLTFMQKYSVNPPDTVAQNLGVKMREMENSTGTDFAFSSMHATKRVAYLNFEKKARGTARSMGGGKGGGSITVDGTYAPRPNAFKSFFLPWNAGSGIIKLDIPPLATATENRDVRYFFTASVNGCSIFIKGTPQAPTIYHAGGQTGHGNNPLAATKFWRDLMLDYSGPEAITGEVNKMDYISNPAAASGFTQHVDDFKAWLDRTTTGDLNIERLEPWGCVMGLRDLRGDWAFYLQENVKIVHSKFKKVLFVKTKKIVKGSETESSRPMIFRKFFPGGLGHVNFQPSMPRKL